MVTDALLPRMFYIREVWRTENSTSQAVRMANGTSPCIKVWILYRILHEAIEFTILNTNAIITLIIKGQGTVSMTASMRLK